MTEYPVILTHTVSRVYGQEGHSSETIIFNILCTNLYNIPITRITVYYCISSGKITYFTVCSPASTLLPPGKRIPSIQIQILHGCLHQESVSMEKHPGWLHICPAAVGPVPHYGVAQCFTMNSQLNKTRLQSDFGLKYQPSGVGGNRSPHAMPHYLLHQ